MIALAKGMKEKKTAAATERKSWLTRPILSPEFTEDPPLEDAFVAVLKDKKSRSRAIQDVTAILPLSGNHLKRCSSERLLLAPVGSAVLAGDPEDEISAADRLKELLRERGFDWDSLLEDRLEIRKVPARGPRTKAQASWAGKIWPVNFHPDPEIESLLDGSIFDEGQALSIERYMRVAIRAAKFGIGCNADCDGSTVIVDPQDGRILAVASSRTDVHPMWHASMIAIDLVAEFQGGGAWGLTTAAASHRSSGEGCGGAKRKHREDAPLFYPNDLSEIPLPTEEPLSRSIAIQRGKSDAGGPYLCTSYWAFLFKEPCTLCAMALLHSRVSRIFYGLPNQKAGVLGSNVILHGVPGLNHRYRVWCGVLEEECEEASREIENSRSSPAARA